MLLEQVPRIDEISKEDFIKYYLDPQRPVVVNKFASDWPAYEKWSLDYMREVAGEQEVPLYDDRPVSYKDGFNQPHARMKMGAYIDLLETKPTNYRIFLYNLLKEVPRLQKDFSWPDIGLKLVRQLPMLFFGGKGSRVFMHFDIDYSNILHFHFHGKKQCVIFPPDQSDYLYKIPHSLIAREDIDFDDPDYEQWPALRHAKGYITNLEHGDMLYMPEGYWHYMKYETPGFSMSLRAFPRRTSNLIKAAYNVFFMRHFDNYMRRIKGQRWIDEKNAKAVINTHRKLGINL
ncbi:cupin-like domain-containing protein [Robertkochia flava]|uniref:cupin-like domain-containing protein n=1 Tax=Robertkochia flava TaxID=3447986 RepID=UPI001CCA04C5|nr:cupin-like domain-containing protein [Robertkochia marina]